MTDGLMKRVILVVEDDRVLLKFYEDAFRTAGIEISIATDGEEGLKAIKEQKPDFVVLDILMPKINGIEVLRQMRASTELKTTPVMMVTNYDTPEHKQAAKELGAVDFVLKMQVSPVDIVKRVTDYLRG